MPKATAAGDARGNVKGNIKGKAKGEDQCEDEGAAPSPLAAARAFTLLVGLLGGFATVLTNSMGPVLNVFLLTQGLTPAAFVGTRSCFFTIINICKIGLRLASGSLSYEMALLGTKLAVVSVLGVWVSKAVVRRLSKTLFMQLEYALMTFASVKLLASGLGVWA